LSGPTPLQPPSIPTGKKGGETLGGDRSAEVKWAWNDAQQQVFVDIKQKVGTSPIFTNPVKVYLSASVLMQVTIQLKLH